MWVRRAQQRLEPPPARAGRLEKQRKAPRSRPESGYGCAGEPASTNTFALMGRKTFPAPVQETIRAPDQRAELWPGERFDADGRFFSPACYQNAPATCAIQTPCDERSREDRTISPSRRLIV